MTLLGNIVATAITLIVFGAAGGMISIVAYRSLRWLSGAQGKGRRARVGPYKQPGENAMANVNDAHREGEGVS